MADTTNGRALVRRDVLAEPLLILKAEMSCL